MISSPGETPMAIGGNTGIDRRTFLKGVGAGAIILRGGSTTATQETHSPSGVASTPVPARPDRTIYKGEHLRAVAMPLGGIGTGSIALAGDGGLRQWQIVHNVNHLAHVPHSFFGIWTKSTHGPAAARILQSPTLYDDSDFKPPRTTNDHVVPPESRKLLEVIPGVREVEFAGEYPLAEVRYRDPALPAEVRLEAYSPFIPLNSKDSGLPAILFEFRVKNLVETALDCSLLATLQNFVGWDGHSPIAGVEHFAYGLNHNTLSLSQGMTAIEMSRPLPDDFPFQGRLVLAAFTDEATYLTQWDDLEQLWADFADDGELDNIEGAEASTEGRTWNGALALSLNLSPGEEKRAAFLITWHFPNRYVNWSQPAITISDTRTKFWLGTAYGNSFRNALEVAEYMRANYDRLQRETRLWRDTLYDSTLPYVLLDCVSSQTSIIRSPTCIWVQDGHLHGFEGCCGASTSHCQESGCCPLNCTHVWNYEQAVARLFPELERSMRHTDLEIQQHPSGYIPHRTILPFYLPRNWDRDIGGPEHPALDGMLGTVLKTYRECRQGGGREWLAPLWPRIAKLMEYIFSTHDPLGEGVIRNEQPNTYDVSIYGVNSFIGDLYLAALRAAEEMARLMGEASEKYRQVYEKGRKNLVAEAWNGEYYVHKIDLEHAQYAYGAGCHADQLLGQWWAHQLGLGYILPPEQVSKAVDSILKYNWREDFKNVQQAPRVFASANDRGLLNCTWPKGGRPAEPTPYSDEVWTGIEYEVAALLLDEGRSEDALRVLRGVRARYDGRERSPWNDVECGDHYARAMSSWRLLEAAAGFRYCSPEGSLAFAPKITPADFRCLFITGQGWGTFEQQVSGASQTNSLRIAYGKVALRTLELVFHPAGKPQKIVAQVSGKPLEVKVEMTGPSLRLAFLEELQLGAGDTLRVEIS